jgi:hypothetical protein
LEREALAERPGRYHGTRIDDVVVMDTKDMPTVEMSLAALSEAVGKASVDLLAVRGAIDHARADIATRNTSISRDIVKESERVIDHLRQADQGLRDVLKDLGERD